MLAAAGGRSGRKTDQKSGCSYRHSFPGTGIANDGTRPARGSSSGPANCSQRPRRDPDRRRSRWHHICDVLKVHNCRNCGDGGFLAFRAGCGAFVVADADTDHDSVDHTGLVGSPVDQHEEDL